MNENFTIKETDIYKLILKEFNNNPFGIKFNYADWYLKGGETDSNKPLMFIQYALNNDRFDVVETFDEETYSMKKQSVVAMNIPVLNGEPLPLKEIKEWVYSPRLEFLVSVENENIAYIILSAIEYIRGRLLQYQTHFECQFIDLNNPNATTKITENFTALFTSGGIEKGGIETINGYKYMSITLDLTIVATNIGLFGNQQKFKISSSGVTTAGVPVVFELPLIEWYWNTATDVESSQLLVDRSTGLRNNAKEVKSIPKTKGFTFSTSFYMDLKNRLMRDLYKKSQEPTLNNDIYTITFETYEYNETTKQYEIATDLTVTRKMILNSNTPTDAISKGERVEWNLTFVPALEK